MNVQETTISNANCTPKPLVYNIMTQYHMATICNKLFKVDRILDASFSHVLEFHITACKMQNTLHSIPGHMTTWLI